jgi:hypothetical protein
MTNTQHTPGPWRIGDAGFTVFGPPKPGALAETIAPVKSRANARLIAAAPEMLAALEALLDCEPALLSAKERKAYAIARAAIAKATGAQP